jgi:diguanylate cyclase (GGDEF)-like protein/PAS domain S-box-containing protein
MHTQAEASLLALIESSEDPVWSVDLQYGLLTYNRAFKQTCERNLGVQARIGMRPHDFPPQGRGEIWPPLYDRALLQGPFRIEYIAIDGRTIELNFNPILINGEPTGVSVFGKDITERNAAGESRQLLARLVESSEDAIVAFAPDGAILTWNRGAEKIFGYSAGEAIGNPISMFVPPDRDEYHAARLEQLLQGQSIPQRDGVCMRKDGRKIFVSSTTWPILNSAGEVTAICVMARDISMRHEAEEARALLASIVESSEDAVHAVKLDGTIASWNRGAEKLFGYSSEEIVGKSSSLLVPPELEEIERQSRGAIGSGSPISPFDTVVRRKDGGDVPVSLSVSPIRNSADEVIGASAIARDISERKRFEHALQEAERKYREIFDGALEGMFQTTFDGRIITANPALARMLGYDSPGELISAVYDTGHDLWVDPDERRRFLEHLREHSAIRGYEGRCRRKDGAVIWVSLSSKKVTGADGHEFHQGFAEEVTERKRAEEALRAAGDSLRQAELIGTLGSYVLEIPTGIWTSSEVLDKLLGISRNYARTVEGWAALVHSDDRSMMAAYFQDEVLATGKTFDKEYRIVRQDDRAERWVHGMGKLEFDALGFPIRMHGIIKDITERKLSEIQVRDSEEQYRKTFEQAAVGIVHVNFEGRILRCNPHFAEIIGYNVHEVPGMTFQQLTPLEYLPQSLNMLRRLIEGALASPSWEKRYIRKDGSLIWVKLTSSIQRDGGGRPIHIITFVQDISARKEAEDLLSTAANALLASEARYRTAFQMSLDAISISRLSDGMYIEVNEAFLRITGFERKDVIGRTSQDIRFWANPHDRRAMVEALRESSSFRDMRTQFRKENGEIFWGILSASLIELDNVACALIVTRDISDAKAAEDKIRDLAFFDPLTRMPNRRLLVDRLQQTLAACTRNPRKRALLFVDLDNFKTLNDAVGHQAGDALLQEVARRLVDSVRDADTVARLGGDEFVVMLEDLNEAPEDAAAEAKQVGEKLLDALGQPYHVAGRECHCPSSIGITVFGALQQTPNEVLQQAEIAMFQAKGAGRNSIHFFSPALQAAVNARAAMEQDLRQAIRNNQFSLFYQPQVDSSGLIGAEALIRWNHPRRGLLSPGEFIPLAEETGMILSLGDWVLESACAQIAAWAVRRETPSILVAVNISARQFRQPDFVDHVLAALGRTGADPRNLKLELTESMLVDNIDEVIEKMTQLRMHGLRFALDDFGTGYSSLAYLKRLPLDELKIDRAFVRDILVDATSGAIAQTINSLGQAMGLSVIAEGVETEQQRDFLAHLGCHSFQGFLFSRPLPLDEFEKSWMAPLHTAAPVPQ